jgi:hypothetical protein
MCADLTRVVESAPVDRNPNDGHVWTVVVSCQGSSAVIVDGEPTDHHISPLVDDFKPVTVQAWNIRDALRAAADLPLEEFFVREEADTA